MKLALFFTEGVSLTTWNQVGMLERELALYRSLQQKGVTIEFVTYGDESDLLIADKMPGMELRANTSHLPISLYKRSLRNRPPKAEIFKSNQVAGADIALHAARRENSKFIARCGYLLSEFQAQKFGINSREAREARRLENDIFSAADAVVVTTEAMSQAIRAAYKIPKGSIFVIPNYVEVDRFLPQSQTNDEQLRVLFVGRLDKQKNLSAFVEAMRPLNVEVWLIGYGPQRDQLTMETTGSLATFKFLGNVPNSDLPQLMNTCDIFVLPSLYEGHPKALLEAMACGLAVVGTRVPGTRELIRDEENGLLCDTDSDSLRKAVNRLIADPSLRQRLGDSARDFIVRNFALEHIVQLELKLLARVMQS